MFTKLEMQNELREFMTGVGRSMDRVFGNHNGASAPALTFDQAGVEQSTLWIVVSYMYDYGIAGAARQPCQFGEGKVIDASDADVELYLTGQDSMALFFEEDNVPSPHLAQRTVRAAIARHVLEGGERYTMPDDAPWNGCLSFAEIALLADMDERSVRNAANPKLMNALVTEVHGKRTVVAVEEARRWLAGRKGFVPTTQAADHVQIQQRVAISVTAETAQRLAQLAEASGVSVEDFIVRSIEENQS